MTSHLIQKKYQNNSEEENHTEYGLCEVYILVSIIYHLV